VAGFIAVASLCMAARADPVPIVSYDVDDTAAVRVGWLRRHAYTGTMTDTGRQPSRDSRAPPTANNVANYAGGSGSLNDGVIDNGISRHAALHQPQRGRRPADQPGGHAAPGQHLPDRRHSNLRQRHLLQQSFRARWIT
jgi:hypothetical protein